MSVATTNDLVTTVAQRPDLATLAAWDRLVEASDRSDVTQLSCWARLRARVGYEPRYVFVHRGPELVAGAQVLIRRVPVLGRIGYVSYGPVVADTTALPAVCDGLERLARRTTRMFFLQPPEGAEAVTDELLGRGFRRSDAGIAPAASIRVDLAQSQDQLRKGLSRRLRTWTNRWEARGVTVRVGSREDIAQFAALMASSAAYQQYEPLPVDYLDALYGELAPGGNVVLFVGEVDGEPVAADLCTVSGGSLRSRLVGLDRRAAAARLSVSSAVKWNAMCWGQARGLHWFDLCGLGDDAAEHLVDAQQAGQGEQWRGQDRFKSKFGGVAYRYPGAVELIRPAPLRWTYDGARRLPAGRALIRGMVRRLRGMRAGDRDGR